MVKIRALKDAGFINSEKLHIVLLSVRKVLHPRYLNKVIEGLAF